MGFAPGIFYEYGSRIRHPADAFCFPGYDARSAATWPPPRFALATWLARVMAVLGQVELNAVIGAHAQAWHLAGRASVTSARRGWRGHAPAVFPSRTRSWRNTGCSREPVFEPSSSGVLRGPLKESWRT